MTQCNQIQFSFEAHYSRKVIAAFEDNRLTSDGGSLLLRQADRKVGLLRRLVGCFQDKRDPERIEHRLQEMLAQRIYGLALGYEDLNDHEQLREDPLLAMLVGKREITEPLAGKSTLNRMELAPGSSASEQRYHKITYSEAALDQLLVDLFLESQETPPPQIILDVDATDMPLYGQQEGRFFHGYYGHYCYLPLYIFCGEHLLCARLRSSNIDASAGSLEEVQRVVAQIRARWPQTRIILRADSGFCREELMSWCEQHGVDYVLGFARNQRLRRRIAGPMRAAKQAYRRTGKPARVFTEFRYRTRNSWSRSRRVIAKAEQIAGKENPRYLVTSLEPQEWSAPILYEQLYCVRGDMENRIKEQLSLFADRLSTETMRSNQLRLYMSSMAYVLVHALRRLGLQGTEWAQAQVQTIRLRLLKIAAQVRITARRIWILYSSSYPWPHLYRTVWSALRC